MKFAILLTPSSVYMSRTISIGPMIPKEMKYNLHYGDVPADVLPSRGLDKYLVYTTVKLRVRVVAT